MEVQAHGELFLVVDDDEMLRQRLGRALESRGFRVILAGDVPEAFELILRHPPAFAVVDMNMPGGSGLDVIKYLAEHAPEARGVVLTGYGSIATAVEAIRVGAWNYVTKPADTDQILSAVLKTPEEHIPRQQIEYKPQTLAESEWDHIQRVLADCGDNISEAARQLGIPRRTLQRKLKKRAP